MSRLLRGDLFRMRKSGLFWWSLAATAGCGVFLMIFPYVQMAMSGYDYDLELPFFHFLQMSGIIMAVFTGIFAGTEYSDGTVRNKLIAGSSRTGIYLSQLITCLAAGAAVMAAGYAVSCVLGIPVYGPPQGEPGELLAYAAVSMAAMAAYVSLCVMISMISPGRTAAVVICILLTFALLFAVAYFFSQLSEPRLVNRLSEGATGELQTIVNPAYVSGARREVYENIVDAVPIGQMISIVDRNAESLGRMALYSAALTAASTLAGISFFRKKDIK
ncbi:MAG TPA: ABC transporter permease subunit [Candidatus Copromorpha excrementigallinarum]|uniref:ABC transporter permease subunit n=1 Tax=Candidatus Allocopromorpha excrementigallinarum TaxID=2840742 RepID=A0A9D1L6E1_9FIRM|nr:ABC transporter permease subunit [Candidatus Copromorpha excrementigallinarum]